MKKVLITGGSGLLGANLARMLSAQNYEVRLFARKNADLKVVQDLALQTIYGDISRAEEVSKAVKGCDYVIHAAGVTAQSGISSEQYELINVDATKNIVQACLQHQVERLIHVSTANTIGPGPIHDPGTELNGFTYFKANSGYINSKYLAQQFVLEQVGQNNLPAIVVNPTFMIGAYDSKPSSGRLILYGLHKKILFYPPGGKNFVHVQDVCQGIIQAITHGRVGNCYLLAGENMSYKHFFRSLGKVANKRTVMIKIPAFALKLGGAFSSVLKMIRHTSPELTFSATYMLCQHNYYSAKKSERELKLTYKPVSEAIRDAYEWFSKK